MGITVYQIQAGMDYRTGLPGPGPGAHELRGALSQSLCVKSLSCISYLWLKEVCFKLSRPIPAAMCWNMCMSTHEFPGTGCLTMSLCEHTCDEFLGSGCFTMSLCEHTCDDDQFLGSGSFTMSLCEHTDER